MKHSCEFLLIWHGNPANMLRLVCILSVAVASVCELYWHMATITHKGNWPYIAVLTINLDSAAGFQHDRRVRLYDVDNDWRLRKDVEARNLRWTITDTCISPDQKFLLYSSISPIVHLVGVLQSHSAWF